MPVFIGYRLWCGFWRFRRRGILRGNRRRSDFATANGIFRRLVLYRCVRIRAGGLDARQHTHYSDKPLDALGAVLLSALAIKALTFFSEQDPLSLLQRWRGGNTGND